MEDEVVEFLETWIPGTEAIVGSLLKKHKVKISKTEQQNIRIDLERHAGLLIRLKVRYRDSLRYTDMGAGRGYAKGQRITMAAYKGVLQKRKRKPIVNKPVWRRLYGLQRVIAGQIVETLISTTTQLKNVDKKR